MPGFLDHPTVKNHRIAISYIIVHWASIYSREVTHLSDKNSIFTTCGPFY